MGPTQATGKGRFNSVSGKRKYEISSWWVHRRNWGLLRENLELLEFNGSFTEFLAPGNPAVRQQYKVEINWRHLQISGSIYLPTYLFIYLSIYPSIHPSFIIYNLCGNVVDRIFFLAHRLTGAGSRKYVYPIIELSAIPPEKLFRYGLNEIMKACIDCILMEFSELRKPRVHSWTRVKGWKNVINLLHFKRRLQNVLPSEAKYPPPHPPRNKSNWHFSLLPTSVSPTKLCGPIF